jgi:putative ABC transport system substrate-binding protein
MIRREFIALAGGVAVGWPFAVRAQQRAMPVIGFLNSFSPDLNVNLTADPIRQGLSETGYVEGQP